MREYHIPYLCSKVVAGMQRFKFQALVTPNADDDGDARTKLSSGSHRMVLRAENSETHRSQVFSALVDGEDDGPFRAGSPRSWSRCGSWVMTSPIIWKSAVIQPLARQRHRSRYRDPSPAPLIHAWSPLKVQR